MVYSPAKQEHLLHDIGKCTVGTIPWQLSLLWMLAMLDLLLSTTQLSMPTLT